MVRCTLAGVGVEKDDREALNWYLKAAEQNYPKAQGVLGKLYLNGGVGVEKDEQEAARWFRKAGQQDNVSAQYNLGVLYATGHGVKIDKNEARRWFEIAQRLGHPMAAKALETLSQQEE